MLLIADCMDQLFRADQRLPKKLPLYHLDVDTAFFADYFSLPSSLFWSPSPRPRW